MIVRAILVIFVLFHFSISNSSLFGQSECPMPTDLTTNLYYPFGEDIGFSVYADTSTQFEVKVGQMGFDPVADPFDTLLSGTIFSWSEYGALTWHDFPANIDYDAYARLICAEADTSVWVGPTSFRRDPPPPPCGMSMDEACEVEVMINDSLPYFTVLPEYYAQQPITDGDSCVLSDEFTWYRFTAPPSGEVIVRALAPWYISIVDSSLETVDCYFGAACDSVLPTPFVSYTVSDLDPDALYFIRYRDALVWEALCDGTFFIATRLSLQAVTLPLNVSYTGPVYFECDGSPSEDDLMITEGCPPYEISRVDSVVDSDPCQQVLHTIFEITDDCGEVSAIGIDHTVSDGSAPVMDCSLLIDTLFAGPTGEASIPDLMATIGIDDCSEEVLVSQSVEAGTILQVSDFCYEVTLTSIDVCGNSSDCDHCIVVANGPTAISEWEETIIQTSRTQEVLTIDLSQPIAGLKASFYTLEGRAVVTELQVMQHTEIPLNSLTSGVYLLSLISADGVIYEEKVTVVQ